MPDPSKFKDKDSYIQRCMQVKVEEGVERNQAYAVCQSVWKEYIASKQQKEQDQEDED